MATIKDEGTVTLPLREYHRFLTLEEKLEQFKKEPDTILVDVGSYYTDRWCVCRPGEAITAIVEKQNTEIKRLQEELEKYRVSKCVVVEHPSIFKRRKWYDLL